MEHAIDYITKEEKALSLDEFKKALNERLIHAQEVNTNSGERSTCINCSSQNTYKDFENMRKAFGQDKGVIAHHYYQSFQKDDDVTPELAHQIGIELSKKMFPNFQVVVSTHIDREHIHNHIIVNSCNIISGMKWYSNKSSLAAIRKESDKLCLQNGLGVITKDSKYKGIDRTTYQLGLKGKSWKISLVRDLEKAIKCCHSKDEFISFMNKRGYSVRYKDIHITITKNGEKKGIRVDTLAKQFGEKFKKENLERKMGYYSPPPTEIVKKYQTKPKTETVPTKSNWEQFEQWQFRQNNCLPSIPTNIVKDNNAVRFANIAGKSLFHSKSIVDFILRSMIILISLRRRKLKRQKYVRYKKVQTLPIRRSSDYITFGNIKYQELISTAGENYSIKVSLDKLLLIANQPVLYSARTDRKNSMVTITVKKKDKDFLADLIDLSDKSKQLDEQSEKLANSRIYHELKETAKQNGKKLRYLIVTPEQAQILRDNFIQFAYFEKEDKLNIAFLPEKTDLIKKLIYPEQQNKTETVQQHNSRIYAQLKKNAAINGEKLKYRTRLTKEQLSELNKSDIVFAYFPNSDDKSLYNIAFDPKDDEKIKSTLTNKNTKRLT